MLILKEVLSLTVIVQPKDSMILLKNQIAKLVIIPA